MKVQVQQASGDGLPVTYRFEQGRSFGVSAQALGETMEELYREHGRVDAHLIVEAAKRPDHRLHSGFEWDVDRAAYEHWLNTARRMLGSLRVRTEVHGEVVYVPAAYSVGHTKQTVVYGSGYRPIRIVVSNPDFRQEAINECLQRLKSLRRRHAALDPFNPIWEMVDEISETLEGRGTEDAEEHPEAEGHPAAD